MGLSQNSISLCKILCSVPSHDFPGPKPQIAHKPNSFSLSKICSIGPFCKSARKGLFLHQHRKHVHYIAFNLNPTKQIRQGSAGVIVGPWDCLGGGPQWLLTGNRFFFWVKLRFEFTRTRIPYQNKIKEIHNQLTNSWETDLKEDPFSPPAYSIQPPYFSKNYKR